MMSANEMIAEVVNRLCLQHGLQGMCIINQGNDTWLAAGLNRQGNICDPRNWDTHRTPGDAIANLLEKLRVSDLGRTPTLAEAMRHPKEFVDGMTTGGKP